MSEGSAQNDLNDSLGSISVMYMRPVFRLKWKRLGARLPKQHT